MEKINLNDPPGMDLFQLHEHYRNMVTVAKEDLAQMKQRVSDKRLAITRQRLRNQLARRQHILDAAEVVTDLQVASQAVQDVAGVHDENIKQFDCLKVAEEEAQQKSLKVHRDLVALPEKYSPGGLERLKTQAIQKKAESEKKLCEVKDRYKKTKTKLAEVKEDLEATKRFYREGIAKQAQQICKLKGKIAQKKMEKGMK